MEKLTGLPNRNPKFIRLEIYRTMSTIDDKSSFIAAIIVPRYKSMYSRCKCIIKTDETVDFVYNQIKSQGGRRGIFCPKRRFIVTAFLSTVSNFVFVAPSIELWCEFDDGTHLFWTGQGKRKQNSSAGFTDLVRKIGYTSTGNAIVQIKINRIADELAPFLEGFPE